MSSSLAPFFKAKGVAVLGASTNPKKLSYGIVKNLLSYGYEGKVYPVNPNADEILGLKVYPSITQVPDPVELAVVVLPVTMIMETMTAWISDSTARVGASHVLALIIKTIPRTTCQNIQSRKLPSWPSQKALKMYFKGSSSDT